MPPAGADAALPDTGAARTNHSPVSGRRRSPGDPQTMEPAHRCIGGWTPFRAGISLSSKQNNDERPVRPLRAVAGSSRTLPPRLHGSGRGRTLQACGERAFHGKPDGETTGR